MATIHTVLDPNPEFELSMLVTACGRPLHGNVPDEPPDDTVGEVRCPACQDVVRSYDG